MPLSQASLSSPSAVLAFAADSQLVAQHIQTVQPERPSTAADQFIVILLRQRGVPHGEIARVLCERVSSDADGAAFVAEFSAASGAVEQRFRQQVLRTEL